MHLNTRIKCFLVCSLLLAQAELLLHWWWWDRVKENTAFLHKGTPPQMLTSKASVQTAQRDIAYRWNTAISGGNFGSWVIGCSTSMTVWGKEWDRNSRFQNNPIKTAGKWSWVARREGWHAQNLIISAVEAAWTGAPEALHWPPWRVSYTRPEAGVSSDAPLSCRLWLFSLSLLLVV